MYLTRKSFGTTQKISQKGNPTRVGIKWETCRHIFYRRRQGSINSYMAQMKKAWCFTLNNFTVEEYDEMCEWMEEATKYAVIGIEFGEQNQNPHIQGYFRTTVNMR